MYDSWRGVLVFLISYAALRESCLKASRRSILITARHAEFSDLSTYPKCDPWRDPICCSRMIFFSASIKSLRIWSEEVLPVSEERREKRDFSHTICPSKLRLSRLSQLKPLGRYDLRLGKRGRRTTLVDRALQAGNQSPFPLFLDRVFQWS